MPEENSFPIEKCIKWSSFDNQIRFDQLKNQLNTSTNRIPHPNSLCDLFKYELNASFFSVLLIYFTTRGNIVRAFRLFHFSLVCIDSISIGILFQFYQNFVGIWIFCECLYHVIKSYIQSNGMPNNSSRGPKKKKILNKRMKRKTNKICKHLHLCCFVIV